MRRTVTVTALVASLLAIPAVASAHPGFNPNELPPGEMVESTLVVPHGCAPGGGMPDSGEDDGGDTEPTVELAVQHIDDVTLEPQDVEGWQVTDDGEAWVWSDDGGATTDVIEFPVMLTIDASVTAGEQLYLAAYQECADGSSFQWIGTPDEEATWPAVKLAASEGAVGTTEPDEDQGEMDHGEMGDDDMGDDEMDADMDSSEDDMPMDEEDGAEDSGEVDAQLDEEPTEQDEVAADGEEAASDDGGIPTLLIVLLLVLVLAAAAGIVVRNRNT